jgi:hypothetical protein
MADDVRARIVEAAVRVLETQGAKGFGQVRVARELCDCELCDRELCARARACAHR